MKSDIDIILNSLNDRQIIRLILEEMPDHKVANIRCKIEPHWADGKYGTWSHQDELFQICFGKPFNKRIELEDIYGKPEIENIKYQKCLLCGEEIQTDPEVHNYSYSHLFGRCTKSLSLMNTTDSEKEYRLAIKYFIDESPR